MSSAEEQKTQTKKQRSLGESRPKDDKSKSEESQCNVNSGKKDSDVKTNDPGSVDNYNEDDYTEFFFQKHQRLPSANWKKQKILQLEQQIEDLKKNQSDQMSNADESPVDWLRIVMDLDGHDVEADLAYVRRDSTEDPPTGLEPFSRPYHERRFSLAGSEEVF